MQKPANAWRRASASASWPIDANTSVETTFRPATAAAGSRRMVMRPRSVARARVITTGSGSYPGGQAIARSSPRMPAASIHEFAMLLPSPTHAYFTARSACPTSPRSL